MAQTNKERKDKYFAGQSKLGRITRSISATPVEFEEIKVCLSKSRYDGLDWAECTVSGHLLAEGSKGQYCIEDNAWKYLSVFTPTPTGPRIVSLGNFHSVDNAKEEAEYYDAKP